MRPNDSCQLEEMSNKNTGVSRLRVDSKQLVSEEVMCCW